MLEKPNLQDEKIISCLQVHYNILASQVEFLPIGNDATAWAYKCSATDGRHYFLKVKLGQVSPAMVAVPRYLNDCGLSQIIAPLSPVNSAVNSQATSDQLWAEIDTFRLIVYPFIDGKNGMDAGMSDDHWIELGALLQSIHQSQPPETLLAHIPKETFVPKWYDIVIKLHAQMPTAHFDDPIEQALASFWLEKADEIEHILERTMVLGQIVKAKQAPFLLCHADIHIYNVMIDEARQLFVVDWDEVIMAPKERDLMFIGGESEALFYQGYTEGGVSNCDPTTLAYYRYEWVVQELGDYGKRVFLMPELGQTTRQHAFVGFRRLFEPGDVVDGAYSSDVLDR